MNRFEEEFPSLKGVHCTMMSDDEEAETLLVVGSRAFKDGTIIRQDFSTIKLCIPATAIRINCLDKARVREAIDKRISAHEKGMNRKGEPDVPMHTGAWITLNELRKELGGCNDEPL